MPANPATSDDLLNELRAASAGLMYPSESDEPFDAFVWNAIETDAVKQLAAMGKNTAPLTEQSIDDFFRELVAGEEGTRYRQMRQLLESRLTGLRILRIGEIEVAVYVIGKSVRGDWAGLHTVSVET